MEEVGCGADADGGGQHLRAGCGAGAASACSRASGWPATSMLRPVTCVTGRDCTRWRQEIQPSAKHRQLLTRTAGPGGWG